VRSGGLHESVSAAVRVYAGDLETRCCFAWRKTPLSGSPFDAKPESSLRVTAADKATNARDMVLDARPHPNSWESKFKAGPDAAPGNLLRMHQIPSSHSPARQPLQRAAGKIRAGDPRQRG